MNALIFLMLPFIQIGYTYYLSVQSVLSLLVLVKLRTILFSAPINDLPIKALVAGSFYLSLFFNGSDNYFWDALRISREAIFFVLMTSMIRGLSGRPFEVYRSQIAVLGLITTVGLTLVLITQKIFLSRGIYFGLPTNSFIMNLETLPDENALYLRSILRPSATFGEPSYCGFILLSIFIIFHKRVEFSRLRRAIIALCFLDAFLVESVAYVLSISAIGYFSYAHQRNLRSRTLAISIGLICIGFIIYFNSSSQLLGRLYSIGSDTSAVGRVFLPLTTLVSFIPDHPFGVPASGVVVVLTQYVAGGGYVGNEILQNALFNLFFLYGLCGIPALILFIRSGSDIPIKLYLLFAANFNGSLFAFDKFAVICFAVCIYESSKQHVAKGSRYSISRAPWRTPGYMRARLRT